MHFTRSKKSINLKKNWMAKRSYYLRVEFKQAKKNLKNSETVLVSPFAALGTNWKKEKAYSNSCNASVHCMRFAAISDEMGSRIGIRTRKRISSPKSRTLPLTCRGRTNNWILIFVIISTTILEHKLRGWTLTECSMLDRLIDHHRSDRKPTFYSMLVT